MGEKERIDLAKELCMCADAKLVDDSFTDWLRTNPGGLLHLVPPGRICLLARTADATMPLLLHAHDLVMASDSPMRIQVSESCVPHHAVDMYAEMLASVDVSAIVPPTPKGGAPKL